MICFYKQGFLQVLGELFFSPYSVTESEKNVFIKNKIEEEDGVLKARLSSKVIGPLSDLLVGSIPAAAVGLDSARRGEDLQKRNDVFVEVGESQRAVISVMREVLVHMVRNEGYQQAVNLLYEIQRAQERMRTMTSKAKEEALKDVLQDKKKSDAPDGGGKVDSNETN